MGNWNIHIQGIGCHHNVNNQTDADLLAAEFVEVLKKAGHTVEGATFTAGCKEDITHGRNANQLARLAAKAAGFAVLGWALLGTAIAAEPPAVESPYKAGVVTVSSFGAYRASDVKELDGKFGAGLALGYALTKAVTLELETLSERYERAPVIDSLEEAGANFKGYLPIGKTGLAGYGLLGYTRKLKGADNRMNAGAGIELRANEVFNVFVDGRTTQNFHDPVHFLFRVGLGARW